MNNCDLLVKQTAKEVVDRQKEIKQDLESILTKHQRDRSDLVSTSVKILNRLDTVEKRIESIFDSI